MSGGFSVFVQPPWHSPRSCYSVLVTPPTEEPLSLEEAKLRAGLSWVSPDPRDDLMRGFIAAARSQVEQDTGLALLTQTRDITAAVAADGTMPLPPQATPLQSIVEVTARSASGARLVLDPRGLQWDSPVRFAGWDATTWSAVTVRVVAGWPTAADLKAAAPLLVQAVGLLTAHMATLGRDLASTNSPVPVPMGYEDAIAPHCLIWVP